MENHNNNVPAEKNQSKPNLEPFRTSVPRSPPVIQEEVPKSLLRAVFKPVFSWKNYWLWVLGLIVVLLIWFKEDIEKRRLEKQLFELNMFVTLEKIEEALKLASQILVHHPDCGEVYYLRGILYFTKSNWLQSLNEFEKAVELDNIHPAKRARSLIYSCYAFCSLKLFEEALSVADEAIAINPRLEAAHRGKAEAYEGLGKYRDSLLYYDKAIQIAPSNLINLQRKAEILRKLDEKEEALKVTEKIIDLDPFNPTAYVKQLQLLRQLHRYQDALRVLDVASDLFPENYHIYYQKALVLDELGQTQQALEALERADFLHPGDRNIRSLLTTLSNKQQT